MKKTFKVIVQNLLAYVHMNVFRGGQEVVYTKIRDAIIKGYRTMYIEGPTGMGKSFIQSTLASALINSSGIKVLLLVPKITLLSQMKREFTRFSKHLHLAVFGGGKKDHGEQVTIMTYQSFLNVPNETLKHYAVIFLDEAHKALGDATRSKVEEQAHAIVIGFTATSSYSEKKNLKEFLKNEVYRISIPEAVKVGMLSAIQFIIGKVRIEISGRQKDETNLEYKERLGKDIIREGGNIAAVRLYKKIFQKRKIRLIMFTASIAQGHDLVRELRANRVTAEIITGATKTSERELLFKKFREGKFKVLVGIDTIKEGFDDPGVHGVMFVYPVGSKVDLIQGAGRGTRIDDNNPNKVAYIVQLAFQTRKQVWYNDALEGKGPFVALGDKFDGIELKKVKRFDVVTADEFRDVSDDIIESVHVDHKDVLKLIRNYNKLHNFERLSHQEKIKIAKDELSKHNIKDYWTLKNFGTKFFNLSFDIATSGMTFVNLVCNTNLDARTLQTMDMLANHLNWTPSKDDEINSYKTALAEHGITDYWILRYKVGVRFTKLDFGVFGKGVGFRNRVLNTKDTARPLSTTDLDEIAKHLGWLPTKEERLDRYRKEFERNKVTNYATLLSKGVVGVIRMDFGIFGKGNKMTSLILETSGESTVSVAALEAIANIFGWEPVQDDIISLLHKGGITDYWKLTANNSCSSFQKMTFGTKKGYAFAGNILGKAIKNVTPNDLEEIAKKLKWIPTKEQRKERYTKLLAEHGITDYWTLKYKYANVDFRSLEFEGIGKGTNFINAVLGRSEHFSVVVREEMAQYFGWVPKQKEKAIRYSEELAKHGITDRASLLAFSWRQFLYLNFGIFGKGTNFLNIVLNKDINKIRSKSLLDDMADKIWAKK